MALGGHYVPYYSGDSLWEYPVDSTGVCPPFTTLHIKLLPCVPLSIWLDGSSGGDATCHVECSLRHLGSFSWVLPCLALLWCHVLQRLHPELVCDQPGSLSPHYLSITLQTAHDPSPGFAACGWCLGIGSANFLPANRDGLAQSRPYAGPLWAWHD